MATTTLSVSGLPDIKAVSIQSLEKVMSHMKRFLESLEEFDPELAEDQPNPYPAPEVYLLVCNDVPVGVYVDSTTADYEMHLCIQGDEYELGQTNKYQIKPLPLVTHRLDQ